jgi:enoyl reductase-like protein
MESSGDPAASGSGLAARLRRHPVIVGVMGVCTVGGTALGAVYLTGDWSLAHRLAAGAVAGAGFGLLLTATKMIG